jgi:hypothetical protein
VNILNKQSQPTRDGPPAWVLGKGLASPHSKNEYVMKCYTGLRTWIANKCVKNV